MPTNPAIPGAAPLLDALNASGDGIALFDDGGTLLTSNPAFRSMNASIADLLEPGLPWDIFLREGVSRGAFDSASANQLELMSNRLADGNSADGMIEAISARNQQYQLRLSGTSDNGMVLLQTPTDKADQIDAVKQAELLLRKVLEACPVNLTMARIGTGEVIYRSPAAKALLGPTRNSFDHFAHRAERADFITALLPEAQIDDMQITGRNANGDEFPATISARLIDYLDEDVIVSNIVDLTDHLKLEETLADQRDQLFQSEKMSALGELLAGVAHELNNPLSIVVGNAVMLKEDTTDPDMLRRITKVSDAAERCVRIVRSFLALAREEPLDCAATDIPDLTESAIELAKNTSAVQPLRVTCRIIGALPAVTIDPVQITQVLVNLITNAAQAIETSGTGDRIDIRLQADPATERIRITVADNGPGVDKEIRSRIFEPLFTTKDAGKGTGVGLAFCHRIVAAHGGNLRLVASEGSGAEFAVDLPYFAAT